MAGGELMENLPIVIIGSGPAGSAAALTLRRYRPDIPVILLTDSENRYVWPAVGETLSPGVLALLDYIGLRNEFLSAGHLPAGGTASAWGMSDAMERNYIFSGQGHGWHLDRRAFDTWLLERAQSEGSLLQAGRLSAVERKGQGWTVWLANKSTPPLEAGFLIDATGRSAALARYMGASIEKHDGLVAMVHWYAHDATEKSVAGALVEACQDGWWYSATLPNGRAVAMYMSDADSFRGGPLAREQCWQKALVQATLTGRHMIGWHGDGEAVLRPANSQRISQVGGEGWLVAGDAAAAFDPLAAVGIGFALRSGMEAARVATEAMAGNADAAIAYADSLFKIYADYRLRLRRIYQAEKRWPASEFWNRRAVNVNLPPQTGRQEAIL
jgi:flavin-dependent dehydrogenase